MLTEYERKMIAIEERRSKIDQMNFARNVLRELNVLGKIRERDYEEFLINVALELGYDADRLTRKKEEED